MPTDPSIVFNARRQTLMDDPTVRYWVKRMIDDLEHRDPVDVVTDLELLTELAHLRLNALSNASPTPRPKPAC
jgi:hypothetical protein